MAAVKIPNHPQQPPMRRQYGVQFEAPLIFRTPTGEYLRLASVFDEHYQRNLPTLLHGYSLPVLENQGTKYTIVIHIRGQKKFSKQKYSARRSGPRTLGGVARQIAEVISEYIEKTQHELPSSQPEGDRWRLGPQHIRFEDLYLVELHQISKASFEVILAT